MLSTNGVQPTVQTTHTQPNPSLPIPDDEERQFWIGNVLYNLLPNNGMAKFMNEVKRLSDKFRYDSFGTIMQNLRDFVATKVARDEKYMFEMAKMVTDLKSMHGDKGRFGVYRPPWENGSPWSGYLPSAGYSQYGYTPSPSRMSLDSPLAGGYYSNHVPNTMRGNGFMFPADHIEMFTEHNSTDSITQSHPPHPQPTPMSYVKQYSLHDSWSGQHHE